MNLRTATVVDGGHRYDYDTNGKRTIEPQSTWTSEVVRINMSVDDTNTWYGLSSAANNGVQTNNNFLPTFSSANGGVFDFDGTDDYIDNATAISSVTNNTEGAVCLWMNADAVIGSTDSPFSLGDFSQTDNTLRFLFDADDVRFQLRLDDGSFSESHSVAHVPTNAWSHAAFSSGVGFFINGVLVSAASSSDWIDDLNVSLLDRMTTGGEFAGSGRSRVFDGLIDDVRIYDRALTSNEVFTIHANTTGDH